MFRSYDDIREAAHKNGPKKIVVCVAHSKEAVVSIENARKKGLATGIFVGDGSIIKNNCVAAGVDINNHQLIDLPDEDEARAESVRLIKEGEAHILWKGSTSTAPFLKAILNKENGLKEGGLISHVLVTKPEKYHKLLLITDAGICIAPTLEQKKMIIENAVRFAHKLGIKKPKVAILCALEKVNPAMPVTVEADKLAQMWKDGEFKGDCIVEGPFALDNAISKECAEIKGVTGDVAGDADILLVPNIEAGNIFAKSILYLSNAEDGGMLVGTTHPVALLSRADAEETKERTIELAVAIS